MCIHMYALSYGQTFTSNLKIITFFRYTVYSAPIPIKKTCCIFERGKLFSVGCCIYSFACFILKCIFICLGQHKWCGGPQLLDCMQSMPTSFGFNTNFKLFLQFCNVFTSRCFVYMYLSKPKYLIYNNAEMMVLIHYEYAQKYLKSVMF